MLIYTIKGMNCGHCVKSVQSALEKIPGVDAVAVTLDPPEARILTQGEVEEARVIESVQKAGYSCTPKGVENLSAAPPEPKSANTGPVQSVGPSPNLNKNEGSTVLLAIEGMTCAAVCPKWRKHSGTIPK